MIWLIAGYGLSLKLGDMTRVAIEHLTHERLLAAWPIIRASGAQPCAEWWIGQAARLIDEGGGVLAARAPDGIVHGVVIYRLARDDRVGKVLSVDTIVAFELSRGAPVRKALCNALDELSLTLECKRIGSPRQQLPRPFFAT